MSNGHTPASTGLAPVLIFGASPRVAVPIARSLARIGVSCEVATFMPGEPRIPSRFIAGFHRLPPTHSPEFPEALCSLIQRRGFDMLIPTSDGPLSAMAQNYERLSSMLYVACPRPDVVGRVLNKAETLRIAEHCGIDVPNSRVVERPEDVPSTVLGMRFPVVIKPRDAKGRGIRVLYADSLDSLASTLWQKAIGAALVQEFCPGAGVGVEVLMHRGEPLAIFQHRRLKETPPGGGVAVVANAEAPDPKLAEASISLLRALEWEGVAMVEYRYDQSTGRAGLMEVNGRFWGTTGLPIAAGVDFPVYLWQMAHNVEPQVPASYKVGTRWRHTAGYLSRTHHILIRAASFIPTGRSRWQELSEIPKDLSPAVRDALWKWSDPMPAVAEFVGAATELIKADVKWVFRKLLPKWLLREKDTYRRLGTHAGRIYLRLRLLDMLGLRSHNRRRPSGPIRSVVFVCHGNIMRSAMAEAILGGDLSIPGHQSSLRFISAGLNAIPGTVAHPWASSACEASKLSLASHRSKQLTAAMIEKSDAVFAMDFQNKAQLLARYPDAESKIFMLSAFATGARRGREIVDPFHRDQRATRACFEFLQECIANLQRDCVAVAEPARTTALTSSAVES